MSEASSVDMDPLEALMSSDDAAQESPRVQPTFMPLAQPHKLFGCQLRDAEQMEGNERRIAVDIMRLFLANRTPITLWGPVGARKTRTIEALAQESDENGVGYQVITMQPSTQDPTIIHGMMYTSREGDKTVMKRSIPDVAKQVVDYHERTGGLTVLFADEMTTAMPSQQNAMLGILTHGKFEGIDISPHIAIAMAANPEGTVSTVNPLGEAVMNRGGHIAWFGDPELFLNEWSTGFGGAVAPPDPVTEWYVRELIAQDPEAAFRNPDKWSTDTLVPWDMMEHTERAVTELAEIITLVNRVFRGRPDAVRRRYIVEVTKALLGIDWSIKMAAVTGMEGDMASPEAVLDKVRASGIDFATTPDQLTTKLGSTLHELASGTPMRQDQEGVIMNYLVSASWVPERTTFDREAYLAAWAFAVTAPTEGQLMAMHEPMTRLLSIGADGVRMNMLNRSEYAPAFVTQELRETLRGMIAGGRS